MTAATSWSPLKRPRRNDAPQLSCFGGKGAAGKVRPSAITVAPRPAPASRDRHPPNAPVNLTAFMYSECASDFSTVWPSNAKLYQIQMTHEAHPSTTDQILKGVQATLACLHWHNSDVPPNLQQLKADSGIHLVLSGEEFVQYRVAWYVVGDTDQLHNALGLIAAYIGHRATNPLAGVDKAPWPPAPELTVNIHAGPGVNITKLPPAFSAFRAALHGPAAQMPHKAFDAAPPFGTKTLVARVEFVDAASVAIAFEGRTYPYRKSFDAANVPGQDDGSGYWCGFGT